MHWKRWARGDDYRANNPNGAMVCTARYHNILEIHLHNRDKREDIQMKEYVVAIHLCQGDQFLFSTLADAEATIWDWTSEEFIDNGGNRYTAYVSGEIDAYVDMEWRFEEYEPDQHGSIEGFGGHNYLRSEENDKR